MHEDEPKPRRGEKEERGPRKCSGLCRLADHKPLSRATPPPALRERASRLPRPAPPPWGLHGHRYLVLRRPCRTSSAEQQQQRVVGPHLGLEAAREGAEALPRPHVARACRLAVRPPIVRRASSDLALSDGAPARGATQSHRGRLPRRRCGCPSWSGPPQSRRLTSGGPTPGEGRGEGTQVGRGPAAPGSRGGAAESKWINSGESGLAAGRLHLLRRAVAGGHRVAWHRLVVLVDGDGLLVEQQLLRGAGGGRRDPACYACSTPRRAAAPS